MEGKRCQNFGSEPTQNIPPHPKLELLMEDLGTYPEYAQTQKLSTLCCELVCADYRCIPRGYRLVNTIFNCNT